MVLGNTNELSLPGCFIATSTLKVCVARNAKKRVGYKPWLEGRGGGGGGGGEERGH